MGRFFFIKSIKLIVDSFINSLKKKRLKKIDKKLKLIVLNSLKKKIEED